MGTARMPMILCFAALMMVGSMPATLKADGDHRSHTTQFLCPTPVPESKRLKSIGGLGLVPEPTIMLDYHMGPVMTGRDEMIKLFVIYYGDFSKKQRSTLRHFFKSFWHPDVQLPESHPTVEKWWQITREYVDLYNRPVSRSIVAAGEVFDNYSLGKDLNQSDIQTLVVDYMDKFGIDSRSIYLVLTSEDVLVEKFCMNVCGTHFYTFPSDDTNNQMVPYGWVGNPAEQCPGLCSWPYAPGGFLSNALIPPNGDAGIDGMIITIANLLAGIATDPYGNGYSQADGLEAAGVCQGIYGKNSFSGFPGDLLVDNETGASFNAYGVSNTKYLIPWIWNPLTLNCAGQV